MYTQFNNQVPDFDFIRPNIIDEDSFDVESTYLKPLKQSSFLELTGPQASITSSYDYFAEMQHGVMNREVFEKIQVRELPEVENDFMIQRTEEVNNCTEDYEVYNTQPKRILPVVKSITKGKKTQVKSSKKRNTIKIAK